MPSSETLNYILAIIAIGSVLFTVYNYFRKPQEEIETRQAVTDKEISNKATLLAQQEVENKAEILAQQFQWEREASEKKFIDFGKRLDDAFLLASNHTNSVDVKVDKLISSVNLMSNEITRLSTIIAERIPKRHD